MTDRLKQLEEKYTHQSMDILEAIDTTASCTVELTDEFTAVCPIDGHRDEYTIYIKYLPNRHLIELESLSQFLQQFQDEAVSQEALTTFIHNLIWTHYGPQELTVSVNGEHYGIEAVTEVRRVK